MRKEISTLLAILLIIFFACLLGLIIFIHNFNNTVPAAVSRNISAAPATNHKRSSDKTMAQKESVQKNEDAAEKIEDINGWKVYVDKEYGFKFKYPSKFTMDNVPQLNPNTAKRNIFTALNNGPNADANQFSVDIVKEVFDLDKLANMNFWGETLGRNGIKEETFNGIKIYSYRYAHGFQGQVSIVPRGDYEIEFRYNIDGGKNDYIGPYWHQIVSSFELIK